MPVAAPGPAGMSAGVGHPQADDGEQGGLCGVQRPEVCRLGDARLDLFAALGGMIAPVTNWALGNGQCGG